MSLFRELKRRNVFRVAIAYLAAAWLLVEVTDTIFPYFSLGETAVRILIILLIIGFPLFLVFSWVFEFTPEGLKWEKDVRREESITDSTGKTLDRIIIVLLILAVGYFAVDKFVLEPARVAEIVEETAQQARSDALVESYGDKSIAVLPFINMSADPDQEYFSDGISEELLNLLAKVPELRVISRSSAFSYKGKDVNLVDVARGLNVAHILEGSVRKSGDRVRITAQLIEARSDTHLWSETYDRTLDDIFSIQDEIAAAVVAKLKLTLLGGPPQADVVDTHAYTLYLQAVYVGAQFGPDSMEQSNALLKQATAIDPKFASAWRLMARNLAFQTSQGVIPKDEGDKLVRQAIERALTIDPNLAIAHSWLAARSAASLNADLVSAAESVQLALSLEPANPDVLSHTANFLQILGRLDQAITVQEYVVTLDPLGPITHHNLGWNYLGAGRPDDALSTAETLRILSPNYVGLVTLEAMALLQTGNHEAAVSALHKEPVEYWRLVNLVKAYHTAKQDAKSDGALAELIEKYGEDRPYWIASVFAYRNETDRSFEWLDKAAQIEDTALQYLLSESSFNSVREDPRWRSFLERIGRSPAQLAPIEFEVKLPE